MDAQSEKYRDIAELGRGGMGDVYLTVASGPAGFNKLLVVKRLRQTLAEDPEVLQMFLHEARIAARLNHPNIVQTYEVGFDGSQYFIAMEYLQGQSMFQLVRAASAKGGLPMAMHLRILVDALAGLHYAHEQRDYDGSDLEIVHRDISPPNIFVLYDGQVKIVDFGIAKTAQSNETRAGIFKGKIQYMAPEQLVGGPLDRRADVYSAGVILWETLARRRLWKGVGDLPIMQRVAAGNVPKPSSVEPDVPKRLEAICMRALSLHPEDRHPTAASLQAELEAFMAESGEQASARDVGKFTAEVFAETRARMRIIIDNQLRVLGTGTDPVALVPIFAPQQATMTGTAAWLAPPKIPPRPRPWRRVSQWVAGALLLLLTGGVGFLLARPPFFTHAAPPAPPVATVAVAAPAPSPNPAPPSPSAPAIPASESPVVMTPPEHTRLIVETVPHTARVALDEALLPADTRQLDMSKDYASHRVWAAAPGYRPKSQWIRFDAETVSVKIVLDRRQQRSDGGREAFRRAAPAEPGISSENGPSPAATSTH
jgi:serine/threonine-protein kinase